ncbi:MAG: FkbM family methyltransferase [Verrucomicrobiota bacterium]|jgi:FkbM family methyltransferase
MLKQLIRLNNMFRNLRNPFTYLGCKYNLLKRDPVFLNLRNDVIAEVPMRLMQTFKESVFAEDYIKGFPAQVLHNFESSTVIDVGANAGYFSLWWLSRFPDSEVISVEPMPNNFSLLQRNTSLNSTKRLHPVNCAVSSSIGEITLHFDRCDSFTTAASVLKNAGGRDELSIQATSIAQLMTRFNLSHIDFLKLDCEGSEYDILYHCDDGLLEKIKCISMETHRGTETNQNKKSLCDFLRSKAFCVNTKSGSAMVYAYRK